MQLYQYKPLDLGFVVLCPEPVVRALRVTANSIRSRYQSPLVAVVPKGTKPEVIAEMKMICPVVEGHETITSLINAGMTTAPSDWNLTVMSGTCVKDNLDKKYSLFIEDTTDILYAIVDGRYEFSDCSLNGIMIHRDTWNQIGPLCRKNPLSICKLMWAQEAIDKGCKLKGVIGVKMA
jgi:hypothetical protein